MLSPTEGDGNRTCETKPQPSRSLVIEASLVLGHWFLLLSPSDILSAPSYRIPPALDLSQLLPRPCSNFPRCQRTAHPTAGGAVPSCSPRNLSELPCASNRAGDQRQINSIPGLQYQTIYFPLQITFSLPFVLCFFVANFPIILISLCLPIFPKPCARWFIAA